MSHNKIHEPALLNKRVNIDTLLFQRTANNLREMRVVLPSTISSDFTVTLQQRRDGLFRAAYVLITM